MFDNWRLVGAVRKVEFKLLQLGLVSDIEHGQSGRSCFRAILTRSTDRRRQQRYESPSAVKSFPCASSPLTPTS